MPDELFAPAPLLEIANRIVEIIGAFYCDHKLLTAGILHQNGYEINVSENEITASDGEGNLRIEFENVGGLFRTVGINLDKA